MARFLKQMRLARSMEPKGPMQGYRRKAGRDSSRSYHVPSAEIESKKPLLVTVRKFAYLVRLKCDRNLPCENCIKRNLGVACTYMHAGLKEKSSISKSNSSSRDVQSQISHLEELVLSLMNRTSKLTSQSSESNTQSTPASSPDCNSGASDPVIAGELPVTVLRDTAESFGRISIEDAQPNYVGSAHWAAILDNVYTPPQNPYQLLTIRRLHA